MSTHRARTALPAHSCARVAVLAGVGDDAALLDRVLADARAWGAQDVWCLGTVATSCAPHVRKTCSVVLATPADRASDPSDWRQQLPADGDFPDGTRLTVQDPRTPVRGADVWGEAFLILTGALPAPAGWREDVTRDDHLRPLRLRAGHAFTLPGERAILAPGYVTGGHYLRLDLAQGQAESITLGGVAE